MGAANAALTGLEQDVNPECVKTCQKDPEKRNEPASGSWLKRAYRAFSSWGMQRSMATKEKVSGHSRSEGRYCPWGEERESSGHRDDYASS